MIYDKKLPRNCFIQKVIQLIYIIFRASWFHMVPRKTFVNVKIALCFYVKCSAPYWGMCYIFHVMYVDTSFCFSQNLWPSFAYFLYESVMIVRWWSRDNIGAPLWRPYLMVVGVKIFFLPALKLNFFISETIGRTKNGIFIVVNFE